MGATGQRLDVSRAVAADLASIMAAERMDGYDQLVGRWSEEYHRSAMHDRRHAYFIVRLDGKPKGFAIVRDWNSPGRVCSVKRIAVTEPGCGYGRVLLSETLRAIFEETSGYRVWLGVFPDNDRARRAYEAVGFQREGLARGNAFFGGLHRDELIMSILRPDWLRIRRYLSASSALQLNHLVPPLCWPSFRRTDHLRQAGSSCLCIRWAVAAR